MVHPDYREKGLPVAMAREAMNALALHYPIFLNFSRSSNSLPGYRRWEFSPMCERELLETKEGLGRVRRKLRPSRILPPGRACPGWRA